jgi:hypothetical protein
VVDETDDLAWLRKHWARYFSFKDFMKTLLLISPIKQVQPAG